MTFQIRLSAIKLVFFSSISFVYSDLGPYIINPTPYHPLILKSQKEMNESLTYWEFFPDILDEVPPHVFQAWFRGDRRVNFGNKFTILHTDTPPYNLSWPVEEGEYYLFHLFDPDVPSKRDPKLREYRHWTVANIPGTNVEKGYVLAEYIGLIRNHTKDMLHRNVFVLYKQPEKLEFDDVVIKRDAPYLDRACFSHKGFAREHRLGKPIAVNFFH
nr:PREDICTED: protein D3-like [Bemisia tabaci]XP_018911674.1 PREDICTED: protein D3-like [Bemisia tabaci]XP_018911675.1 PREDICTED: protein D3-like [Bemisia tabaci]